MTGYKGKFSVKWWAWYLVDTRDWHKPVIVRKHFTYKKEAIDYKERWLGLEFEPIEGYKAMDLNLKDGLNKKVKHRHPTRSASKYHFPPGVITQKQKQLYRLRQQRKVKRIMRLPELTNKGIYYLLDKKPIKFCILTKKYLNWNYPYTSDIKLLSEYIRYLKWPSYVRLACIIEKTLIENNYDIGPWPITSVIIKTMDIHLETLVKFCVQDSTCKSPRRAKAELIARGFIPIEDSSFKLKHSDYVVTTGLGEKLIWPDKGWYENGREGRENREVDDYYITWLATNVGIPNFTRTVINSKS